MSAIEWKHFVGQSRIKELLGNAFANGALGHAYLFCGDEGCGTLAAACDMGRALLCESEATAGCDECPGCRKIASMAHPGFSLLCPLPFGREHRGTDGSLSEAGWDWINESVRKRIADPYLPLPGEGSRSIPLDWVKEVLQSIGRSRGREGKRHVVILADADLLRKETANAMLKTIEEPPVGTFLFLCTSRPHAVLQTIRSRCQVVRFGHLTPEQIRAELLNRMDTVIDDARLRFAVDSAQGSLCAALAVLDEGVAQVEEDARLLMGSGEVREPLAVVAHLERMADQYTSARLEQLLQYCLITLRTTCMASEHGAGNYFGRGFSLRDDSADRATEVCETALAAARNHGNALVLLVAFYLEMMEIVRDGKEQQAD